MTVDNRCVPVRPSASRTRCGPPDEVRPPPSGGTRSTGRMGHGRGDGGTRTRWGTQSTASCHTLMPHSQQPPHPARKEPEGERRRRGPGPQSHTSDGGAVPRQLVRSIEDGTEAARGIQSDAAFDRRPGFTSASPCRSGYVGCRSANEDDRESSNPLAKVRFDIGESVHSPHHAGTKMAQLRGGRATHVGDAWFEVRADLILGGVGR